MQNKITSQIVSHLQKWQGNSEVTSEPLALQTSLKMAATLESADIAVHEGDTLPPLWHWSYFTPRISMSELGIDGHPKLGGFMPPVPLPRRMWAGGRVTWHADFNVGDIIEKTTTIVSIKHKAGRSGDLVFALLQHDYHRGAELVVTEEQDIVYRAPANPTDPVPAPTPAPTDEDWCKTITPSAPLLFRYSALTFNTHRIHYDRPYAINEEGYEGLVVHGPLIATYLAELLRQNVPEKSINQFNFRAVRATLDMHPFEVCGKLNEDGNGATLWSRDHEGWLTMQADVTFA